MSGSILATRRWVREGRSFVFALGDCLALLAAGTVAFLAWARPLRHQHAELYLDLWPLLALFVLGYAQAGLYPGFGLGPVESLRRLSLVTGFSFLVIAAISFGLKLPARYSRVTFVIALGAALILVPLTRALVSAIARRWRWWLEPVVVVAEPPGMGRWDLLERAPHLGFRPVALLSMSSARAVLPPGVEVHVGGVEEAGEMARRGIRTALVEAVGPARPELLNGLQQQFARVVMLQGFGELPVEGVQVRNLGGMLGLELRNNLLETRNRVAKRILDLLAGGVGLLVASPLIALAAAAVKVMSPGSAFFTQSREGLDGRRIRVPKIRTMVPDAEAELERRMSEDPSLRDEWENNLKLRDDPRLVPRVGRLLRRFSIDELPQLWSVLRGDMSLVGPRPFPDYHLARFSPHFRALRRRVRPGITGLWQVTVRSAGPIEQQESLDTFYIRNWSIWLDLYILARTLGAVVGGKGAY